MYRRQLQNWKVKGVDRSSGPKREMRPIPLTEIPLFAGLSDAAKAELRSTCTVREYSGGDVILKPGELGAFLFAIAMGTVSVRPASGQRELAIVLGPGEVFGEMSLLSGAPFRRRSSLSAKHRSTWSRPTFSTDSSRTNPLSARASPTY
jgi:hypothetical protein